MSVAIAHNAAQTKRANTHLLAAQVLRHFRRAAPSAARQHLLVPNAARGEACEDVVVDPGRQLRVA